MVNIDQTVGLLTRISLFQGLNNRQLKQIAGRVVQRNFQQDEPIVTQGKGGFGMFILISGQAEAVLELADGSKTVVNQFGPNDFFGEVNMLDGGPRTASVIARQETECLFLGRVELIALMHDDADMAIEIAAALARRLRRTTGMM